MARRNQQAIDAVANAEAQQDFLRAAADMGAERLQTYSTYRQAYKGEHQVQLSDRQRLYLQRSGIPWCENFCETIVDFMVGRMTVEAWTANVLNDTETDGEESAEKDVAEIANDWWSAAHMNAVQAVVHEETAVCADGFVIVDWDSQENRPRFTFNRPEMIKPVYDPDQPDTLLYVPKVWDSSLDGQRIRRLNLYYPDRIEKWFTFARAEQAGEGDKAQWHAFIDPADYTEQPGTDGGTVQVPTWPIPWVDQAGEPLGIPVVHFRNKPGSGCFGRSELRSVIPQNEALNKTIQDLLDVVDYLGSPVPYVTGLDGDLDRTFVVGEWLQVPNAEAKVGMLPGADPAGILAAIAAQLQRIAARSQTPLHALVDSGQLPSGEALKAAEAPGVHKIRNRSVSAGNAWAQCMTIAAKLATVYGTGYVIPAKVSFVANWADPETRNEQSEALTAQAKHDIGVSKHTLLTELGYDPEREKELRAQEAEEAMAAQEKALASGALGAGAYGDRSVPTKPDPANPSPTVPA